MLSDETIKLLIFFVKLYSARKKILNYDKIIHLEESCYLSGEIILCRKLYSLKFFTQIKLSFAWKGKIGFLRSGKHITVTILNLELT